ncbi:tyrosine-type recombinase/integrase [Corynebacterium glutamicum]|uniref:tyrosine-type recombinase/integrase n=1 Tax=Corynebacterium glutamicum TaxID=1718 RepID=UPI003B5C7071
MGVQRRPKKGSAQDKGQKPRWLGRYRDHAGKEHAKNFSTEKEAKAWVAEQERALRRNEWIDPVDAATTLGQVAQSWMDEATREETISARKTLIRNLGPLEDMPVSVIKSSDILAWRKKLLTGRDWLDGSVLSEATTANTVGQLMSVLKRAQHDRMILAVPIVRVPKSAPARSVSRQDLLTEEEVQRAATAVATGKGHYKARPWLRSMILVAAGSGLRVSEVCALRPEDVNFLRHTITVSRQMGRGGVAMPPKSQASLRTIPVPRWVTAEIVEWLQAHPVGESGWVWTRPTGKPDRPFDRSAVTHGLLPAIKAHDLRPHTFHDYRHFYASALIGAGVPVNAVQSAMGHASASITLDTYSHLWKDSDELVRGALDSLTSLRANCGQAAKKAPDSHTG